MSLEFLEPLEARVAAAIARIEALTEENARLERRVAELETARNGARGDGAAAWRKDRDEIRRRVEALVGRLEALAPRG